MAILAALILTIAFGFALFHFHAGFGDHHDCPVCRLVQTFGLLFAFTLIAFVTQETRGRDFLPVASFSFQPLFLSSKLRDRAPPFLK